MDMTELLEHHSGRTAVRCGVQDALYFLDGDLKSRAFGGDTLAFNVVARRMTDDHRVHLLPDDFYHAPDADSDINMHRATAKGGRDLSLRTKVTSRLAIATGMRYDDEVDCLGNAACFLDIAGVWQLIISCGGLEPIDNEIYATLLLGHIARRLRLALAMANGEVHAIIDEHLPN